MLTAGKKVLLIPALVISVGLIFSLGESKIISAEASYSYPEHLAGAFTGGFGEETCHSCHFDYDVNQPGGNVKVIGLPAKIAADTIYELNITVQREELEKAGFQLTARFPDGRQAGVFDLTEDERLMFTKQVPDSLQYVQHSAEGTKITETHKSSWKIQWASPSDIPDSVIFNIAANAANGDQSEFGDWIYVQELKVGEY